MAKEEFAHVIIPTHKKKFKTCLVSLDKINRIAPSIRPGTVHSMGMRDQRGKTTFAKDLYIAEWMRMDEDTE